MRVGMDGIGHRRSSGLLAAALIVVVLATAVSCSDEEPGKSGTGGRAERPGRAEGHPYKGSQKGPYKVRTQTVPADDADGHFGSATVRFPAGDSRDRSVIAASPGLGADESMVAPYGELLASHGFVVITFNTRTLQDSPAQRGRQLLDALDYVTERSDAADRADPEHLGVLGHSMGGGGTLYAASRSPKVKAAVALTPYSERGDWPGVPAPTLIVGGSRDEIAAPSEHAEVFYKGLSKAREKMYLALNGDHFVATPPDELVARQVIAWFKRFLDGDKGYDDDLCPAPRAGSIVEARDTCPIG
jgi:alpha/beta superfamily hydrolase